MISQLNLITLPDWASACIPSVQHALRNISQQPAKSRAPKEIEVLRELGLAVWCLVNHFCLRYRRLLKTVSQIDQRRAGQSALC